MIISLDYLSDKELQLYAYVVSLRGTIEEIDRQLAEKGTFDEYRAIHQQYLELFNSSSDANIKLEALKRLIFLNWYSVLEPSFLTGIDILREEIISESYSWVNDFIVQKKLDSEFTWMLSYYSSWDYIVLDSKRDKLEALKLFVKNVASSVLQIPLHKLPKGIMDNRGQMGIYFKSIKVES